MWDWKEDSEELMGLEGWSVSVITRGLEDPPAWEDQLWLTQNPEEVVNHADVWSKCKSRKLEAAGWAVCKEQAMCLEVQGGTVTGLMGPDYSSCILNEMESHWKFEQRSTCQPSYSLSSFWIPYGE